MADDTPKTGDTPKTDDAPFTDDSSLVPVADEYPLIVTIENTVSSPEELDALNSRLNPIVRNIIIGMQESNARGEMQERSARGKKPKPKPLQPKHIKAAFSLTFQ